MTTSTPPARHHEHCAAFGQLHDFWQLIGQPIDVRSKHSNSVSGWMSRTCDGVQVTCAVTAVRRRFAGSPDRSIDTGRAVGVFRQDVAALVPRRQMLQGGGGAQLVAFNSTSGLGDPVLLQKRHPSIPSDLHIFIYLLDLNGSLTHFHRDTHSQWNLRWTWASHTCTLASHTAAGKAVTHLTSQESGHQAPRVKVEGGGFPAKSHGEWGTGGPSP